MNKEKTIAKELEDKLFECLTQDYSNFKGAQEAAEIIHRNEAQKCAEVAKAYANKRVTEAIEEVEKLKELAKEMLKKDIAVGYMEGFIKAQKMFVNHIIKSTNENQIIEDINTHYIKESDALAYAEKIIKKSEWLNV